MIRAVVVLSPRGSGLVVAKVALHDGAVVWDLAGGAPRVVSESYGSSAEVLSRYNRSVTSAVEFEFRTVSSAVASLGRDPAEALR